MITVRKEQPKEYVDLFEKAGLTSDSLLFDIETTGLSPYDAGLYLIGVLFVKDGIAESIQWLAESFSEEQAILRAFLDFAEPYGTVVSFNGDGFDLRFLEECAAEYHLPFSIRDRKSIDLFKTAKKLKPLTGLTSCRQKNVEEYLGILREDPYSGGELIQVYERFVKNHEQTDLDALLLHNRNDIEGLVGLLPLLPVLRFLNAPELSSIRQEESTEERIRFTASLPISFPRPVRRVLPNGNKISIEENRLLFEVHPFHGSLKLFFPDWRNYAFLPNEGRAIHKKLAEFVDPSRKVPATRETAYALTEGVFVPESEKDALIPSFRASYADKNRFIRLKDLYPETYLVSETRRLLTGI